MVRHEVYTWPTYYYIERLKIIHPNSWVGIRGHCCTIEGEVSLKLELGARTVNADIGPSDVDESSDNDAKQRCSDAHREWIDVQILRRITAH